jgi:hypothetical protein
MKKISTCIAVLIIVHSFPMASHAQFLKNLMSSVNQSIQNKAGNKAANQVAGKPDSTAKTGTGSSTMPDSNFMAKMMASMAKPKPSISPADSAAAIKAFTTATGGSGLYYAYKLTERITIKGKDSTIMDTMATSIAESGNSRSEFGLFGGKMVTLGHFGQTKYSMSLDIRNKTYWLNIIDTAAINHDNENYQVTKVGPETVGGYHCIHSKLTLNFGGKTPIVEDIWTSTEVAGYAGIKKWMSVRNVTPKMIQALDQAGCGGFFVQMTMKSPTFSMDMLLIDVAHKSFPASLFEIPPGYTQSNNGSMFLEMMGAKK